MVLPSAATWAESEGTVTSSERRVQLVRRALVPPGEARDDIAIICDLARCLGHEWDLPTAEQAWDELRSLSPMHAGMSYARLEELGGLQWPCVDEQDPGATIALATAVGSRSEELVEGSLLSWLAGQDSSDGPAGPSLT